LDSCLRESKTRAEALDTAMSLLQQQLTDARETRSRLEAQEVASREEVTLTDSACEQMVVKFKSELAAKHEEHVAMTKALSDLKASLEDVEAARCASSPDNEETHSLNREIVQVKAKREELEKLCSAFSSTQLLSEFQKAAEFEQKVTEMESAVASRRQKLEEKLQCKTGRRQQVQAELADALKELELARAQSKTFRENKSLADSLALRRGESKAAKEEHRRLEKRLKDVRAEIANLQREAAGSVEELTPESVENCVDAKKKGSGHRQIAASGKKPTRPKRGPAAAKPSSETSSFPEEDSESSGRCHAALVGAVLAVILGVQVYMLAEAGLFQDMLV